MKKLNLLILIFAMSGLILSSCGKSGPDPVPVGELTTHTDEVTGFSVKYPESWIKSAIPGTRFVVFSNDQGKKRFNKYDTEGFPGAKIDVICNDLKPGWNLDSLVKISKIFGDEIYEVADVTIDGVPGKKLVYSFPLSGGMFNGMMLMAAKDTVKATTLIIEAFDNSFETYKSTFDEIASSFVLGKAPAPKKIDTILQVEEAPPPSENLEVRGGDGFEIGVPDNFKAENIGKAANAQRAWSFLGARRGDSFIKIETFDASQQKDLKKIVDENRASFQNANPKETTLGGKKAYLLEYKPAGTVKGKVWFALSGDKMYRVTINWFTGEEKDFLPVFEKSVASFKFK
ncbi:MAG: hypothetical protein KIT33_02675 [Candidatus Kapabacteria bacterium]|nr:hypothetical protein [Ignavibacteriota bacterium]MCW5883854.1 hypothetical protein [Candidatus Kapabacteria bacterium]